MFKIFVLIAIVVFLYVSKKRLANSYKKVRFVIKTWTLVFLCMLFTSVCLPVMILRGKHYTNGRFGAKFLKHISKIYGIEWRLRNGHILEKDQGCIVVSNHQTLVDMIGIFNIWEVPKKVVIVAKKTVMYAGTFGVACYFSNTVFIDRTKPKEGYKRLEAARELMVNHKVKVWVYPEGTRNTQRSESILPFKKGAFIMAVTAQVPIIPVVYSPYTFIDSNKYEFGKGHITMHCLEPIPTSGLTIEDVPVLTNRVRDVMVKAYETLSTEVSLDETPQTLINS